MYTCALTMGWVVFNWMWLFEHDCANAIVGTRKIMYTFSEHVTALKAHDMIRRLLLSYTTQCTAPACHTVVNTMDVERGSREYKPYDAEPERESLLPSSAGQQLKGNNEAIVPHSCYSKPLFGFNHMLIAFVAGTLTCFLAQYAICGSSCFSYQRDATAVVSTPAATEALLAPPWAGSTERHNFPPATPTNAFPSMFPTDVGYPGKTPTGAEPAVVATAPLYPMHTGAAVLVVPETLRTAKGKKYNLFKKWGNLSPWYSVDRKAFGLDSGPETPETCRVTGLHFLHRHGARYPTAYGERMHSVA
jgi:hypothetical protein